MGAMLDTCFKGHAFAHSGALHPAVDRLLVSGVVRQCTQRAYAECRVLHERYRLKPFGKTKGSRAVMELCLAILQATVLDVLGAWRREAWPSKP